MVMELSHLLEVVNVIVMMIIEIILLLKTQELKVNQQELKVVGLKVTLEVVALEVMQELLLNLL